jgi:hypothetical protein
MRRIIGITRGTVITGEASETQRVGGHVWHEDGLYVDRVVLRAADGEPVLANSAHGTNGYEQTTGTLHTAADGTVTLHYSGNSALPVYRLAGFDDFVRTDGTVELPSSPPAASASGTGLRGEYFSNTQFQGAPAIVRAAERIRFSWTDSPAPGVSVSNYSARWAGQVETPMAGDYVFSIETETFTAQNVVARLWVDGRLLIDHSNPATFAGDDGAYGRYIGQGRIALDAARRYDIRLEYSGPTGGKLNLTWENSTLERESIPTRYLYNQAPNGNAVHAGGLQARWRFEDAGGTSSANDTGPQYALAISSTRRVEDGVIGRAIGFDGVASAATTTLPASSSSYAFSIWFRTRDRGRGIYALGDSTAEPSRTLYIAADGSLRATLGTVGGAETLVAEGDWADGRWHQAVHVFGGPAGAHRLYVDGVTRAIGRATSAGSGASTLTIGRAPTAPVASRFRGDIDEATMHDRALSPREVRDSYRAEIGLIGLYTFDAPEPGPFGLGNSAPGPEAVGAEGYRYNSATLQPAGRFGRGLRSDGGYNAPGYAIVYETLDVPRSEVTIMTWFRTAAPTVDLISLQRNLGGYLASWNRTGLSLEDGRLRTSVDSVAPHFTTATFNDGAWHHAALVIGPSAGGRRVYVDGVLVLSDGVTSTGAARTFKPGLLLGSESGRVDLDDVRVYARALDAESVRAAMANGALFADGFE